MDGDLTLGVGRVRETMQEHGWAKDLAKTAEEYPVQVGFHIDDGRQAGGEVGGGSHGQADVPDLTWHHLRQNIG